MKYSLIYADPAWSYRDKANDGCRGASHKYPVMSVQDICRLPVWELANPESCLLAMWWVPTQPREALQVLEAWGFRLMTTKGFTWHKTNKHKGNSAMGMGHMTRANSEDMLFAVRGRLPARLDASICQHVTAPRGAHSAKPDIFRQLLVQLLGDVPRIELFSRSDAAGWEHWGNEAPSNSVELRPGVAIIPANDNEPTISPLAALTDELTWLVRITGGQLEPWCEYIARDGENSWACTRTLDRERVWFTRAQYLERKEELQNKPRWEDHPDAKCIAQNSTKCWVKNVVTDEVVISQGLWVNADHITRDNSQSWRIICTGEVIGDWRDTLERRPADLTIQQAGGAA